MFVFFGRYWLNKNLPNNFHIKHVDPQQKQIFSQLPNQLASQPLNPRVHPSIPAFVGKSSRLSDSHGWALVGVSHGSCDQFKSGHWATSTGSMATEELFFLELVAVVFSVFFWVKISVGYGRKPWRSNRMSNDMWFLLSNQVPIISNGSPLTFPLQNEGTCVP